MGRKKLDLTEEERKKRISDRQQARRAREKEEKRKKEEVKAKRKEYQANYYLTTLKPRRAAPENSTMSDTPQQPTPAASDSFWDGGDLSNLSPQARQELIASIKRKHDLRMSGSKQVTSVTESAVEVTKSAVDSINKHVDEGIADENMLGRLLLQQSTPAKKKLTFDADDGGGKMPARPSGPRPRPRRTPPTRPCPYTSPTPKPSTPSEEIDLPPSDDNNGGKTPSQGVDGTPKFTGFGAPAPAFAPPAQSNEGAFGRTVAATSGSFTFGKQGGSNTVAAPDPAAAGLSGASAHPNSTFGLSPPSFGVGASVPAPAPATFTFGQQPPPPFGVGASAPAPAPATFTFGQQPPPPFGVAVETTRRSEETKVHRKSGASLTEEAGKSSDSLSSNKRRRVGDF